MEAIADVPSHSRTRLLWDPPHPPPFYPDALFVLWRMCTCGLPDPNEFFHFSFFSRSATLSPPAQQTSIPGLALVGTDLMPALIGTGDAAVFFFSWLFFKVRMGNGNMVTYPWWGAGSWQSCCICARPWCDEGLMWRMIDWCSLLLSPDYCYHVCLSYSIYHHIILRPYCRAGNAAWFEFCTILGSVKNWSFLNMNVNMNVI